MLEEEADDQGELAATSARNMFRRRTVCVSWLPLQVEGEAARGWSLLMLEKVHPCAAIRRFVCVSVASFFVVSGFGVRA